MAESNSSWAVYMIRCGDGSLYTGITTDVERRLREHKDTDGQGRGAKFLRGKQPLQLVYKIQVQNRSSALQMEYALKQLSKSEKESLVRNENTLPELLNRKNTE